MTEAIYFGIGIGALALIIWAAARVFRDEPAEKKEEKWSEWGLAYQCPECMGIGIGDQSGRNSYQCKKCGEVFPLDSWRDVAIRSKGEELEVKPVGKTKLEDERKVRKEALYCS